VRCNVSTLRFYALFEVRARVRVTASCRVGRGPCDASHRCIGLSVGSCSYALVLCAARLGCAGCLRLVVPRSSQEEDGGPAFSRVGSSESRVNPKPTVVNVIDESLLNVGLICGQESRDDVVPVIGQLSLSVIEIRAPRIMSFPELSTEGIAEFH
jgi:hypothetical protein